MINPNGEVFAVGQRAYSFTPYYVVGSTSLFYYRNTNRVWDLTTIDDQIHSKYPDFKTISAIVVTWNQTLNNTRNFFQFAMATDETSTVLLFNYRKLETPVNSVFYMIDKSKAVNFNASVDKSNCDVPGRFIFLVEGKRRSEFFFELILYQIFDLKIQIKQQRQQT
jgi:hypothetical protein